MSAAVDGGASPTDSQRSSEDHSTGDAPIHVGDTQSHTWQPWIQVFLSHLINFNSFGYLLSFGIFQSYYSDVLELSPSSVSWIGTTQLFLIYFVGIFSGNLMDAGYYKWTLVSGFAFQLVGAFSTSFSKTYWQLYLSQGLCQGIGSGLLFCPAVALVATYFAPGKRAYAMSLVACGGATGGMIFPTIAQQLLDSIGFAWTVRIMGFVMLFVACIATPFSRPKENKPRIWKSWLDLQAFKEPPYVLFCIGIFLAFWGLYFAYYYVRSFAKEVLHASQETSFNLLILINTFGIPGRIIPNLLADKFFGPLNCIIPVDFACGVLLFCWIAMNSSTKISAAFYVWTCVYGFFAGGAQSLFQASASSLAPDLEKVGVRFGMVCTIASFACLSGPPLCGWLIEVKDGSYLVAQLFGGSVLVAGSGFLALARYMQLYVKGEQLP